MALIWGRAIPVALCLTSRGSLVRVQLFPPLHPLKNGPVVQLVRTLACHARGRRFESVPGRHFAQIAQLVEQRTENPRVSGSIPELGTRKSREIFESKDFPVFSFTDDCNKMSSRIMKYLPNM